ncbi:hypothetical protein PV10_00128 [Exophiala mesophila]|uniref:Uncharacterized protein n=1 Tax=Exophiala mesophila TaxID=212818 RepID=A0A0D2ABC9_EXOME|nr:uncharacterized protein PV10_00128 [Exophiala mesophila]KIV96238.1 hypothetical protein PV10_00128 [Exophiala mesophila]
MISPPDQAPLPANAPIGGIKPKAASTATIEVNGERLDIRILESIRDWVSWYGWLSDLFVDRNCWSLLHADDRILEKHRPPLPLLASRNELNEYIRLCDAYDEQQIRLFWAKDIFWASLSSEVRLETARLGFCEVPTLLWVTVPLEETRVGLTDLTVVGAVAENASDAIAEHVVLGLYEYVASSLDSSSYCQKTPILSTDSDFFVVFSCDVGSLVPRDISKGDNLRFYGQFSGFHCNE